MDVAYDGTDFAGWQRQAGLPTVQAALEEALGAACGGDAIAVAGSSRTDAGVHALHQAASACVETRLDNVTLQNAINARLPRSVAIRKIVTMNDSFHARFSARGKRYAYRVESSERRDPLGLRFSAWLPWPLDLAAMRVGASHLRGRHDFAAFATAGSPRASTVRTIRSVHISRRKNTTIFAFEGDGFLYNQVRAMVGTLLLVGQRKLAPADVETIREGLDRKQAGPTAPPEGLFLLRVLFSKSTSPALPDSDEDCADGGEENM